MPRRTGVVQADAAPDQARAPVEAEPDQDPYLAAPGDEANKNEKSAPGTGKARAANTFGGLNHIGALALVFDRLSPNARNIARQASLTYLNGGLRADDFVGVFGIDLSLHVWQRFTNDERQVRQGIEQALSHSPSTYQANADKIAQLADQQAGFQDQISNAVGILETYVATHKLAILEKEQLREAVDLI